MGTFNFLSGNMRLCGTDIVCADLVNGLGVTGSVPLTGGVSFASMGDITLTYSGNNIVIGGGTGSSIPINVSTTGVLGGFATTVFNHNKNSLELTPKLYVRKVGTNNWQEPDYDYNGSFFEKDYTNYGIYDFRTGTAIDRWSGVNLFSSDFIGFSGGKILCIANSVATNLNSDNNDTTCTMLVKPYAGDFDIWCRLSGDYAPDFIANGIVALSLNATGTPMKSFVSAENTSGGCRYKYRDLNGNSDTLTPRPKSPFIRLKRNNNICHAYFKTGINESWTSLLIAPTGRIPLIDAVVDSIYLGVYLQTNVTTHSGKAYTWDFFKSWSPIELQASGANNILVINNVGLTHEIKVTV